MNTEIYDTLVNLIDETCEEVELDDIHPEVNLLTELAVDSLSLVEVVFDIDEKYGIKVPLEDWQDGSSLTSKDQSRFKLCHVVEEIEKLVAAKEAGTQQSEPIYKQHAATVDKEAVVEEE